jgi:hypothetical protein
VPFCAYEFSSEWPEVVDFKLASPTGFEPVGLQNGPLIPKHLGHANHLLLAPKTSSFAAFCGEATFTVSRSQRQLILVQRTGIL